MKNQKSNSCLVLTNKEDECITIGGVALIYVARVKDRKGRKVIRTYIQAPKDLPIKRYKILPGTSPFDGFENLVPTTFKRSED